MGFFSLANLLWKVTIRKSKYYGYALLTALLNKKVKSLTCEEEEEEEEFRNINQEDEKEKTISYFLHVFQLPCAFFCTQFRSQ